MADGGKLADDFGRLGKHIENARSAYDSSEKRLTLMVDRVRSVMEIGESEEQAKIPAETESGVINIPDN